MGSQMDLVSYKIKDLELQKTDYALQTLFRFLRSGDVEMVLEVIEALPAFVPNPAVKEKLIELTRHRDGYIRYSAVHSLSHFKDQETEDILIEALNDPDSLVQMEAAEKLGYFGSRLSVPHMLPLLLSEDELLRGEVALAIGRIGEQRIIPIIERLLLSEQSDTARVRYFSCLVMLGCHQYWEPLLQMLNCSTDQTRIATANLLVEFSNNDNRADLIQAIRNRIKIEPLTYVKIALEQAIFDMEYSEKEEH